MLRDLLRFYREAPVRAADLERDLIPLGEFLQGAGYGAGFVEDHLLPLAAAIWSIPAAEAARYPATAFIRFCENHGLLRISNRPAWRTVDGGSREYVTRLTAPFADAIRTGCPVRRIERVTGGIRLWDGDGAEHAFDDVVIATHAPQALAMLADPSDSEHSLLGAIRTAPNRVVLHRDARLMPQRRAAWSSWNYIGRPDGGLCVTYWLDRLQGLPGPDPHFVTLNPPFDPADTLDDAWLHHPMFDAAALRAQRRLWSLQGQRNTWFCGAWFGAGFHEDGLQSGLAVAEQLGGLRRPWAVPDGTSRIHLEPRREAA
jgi:predicted NAD/FAD-binding protein